MGDADDRDRVGWPNYSARSPWASTSGEWKRVRNQPYMTERILHQSRRPTP